MQGLKAVCVDCDHEWVPSTDTAATDSPDASTTGDGGYDDTAPRDSMGNVLANGDSCVTVLDLIADGKMVRLGGGGATGKSGSAKVRAKSLLAHRPHCVCH